MEEQNNDPRMWVDKYGDYLYSFAISRVYDSMTAEDLVQDTFYSAFKAKDSFLGNSTERTWLTSILKRKIIDHYRKNARSKEDKILDSNNPFQKEGVMKGHWEDEHLPHNWLYEDSKVLESKEFYATLKNCLSKLPEKWQAVFTLKEIDEVETEQVCKELDITSTNLWVIMHRAKVHLRKCIEKNWFMNDKIYSR